MSRFPSPMLANRIDDRIQELEDEFVRLGDEDTPFALQGGRESVEESQQFHNERDERERERDEESNEPVTRTVSKWRADMMGLGFLFVDTIPLNEQRGRANQVQSGVVLAHEVGHAFYDTWSPDSGIEEQAPTLPQYGRNGTGDGPFRATPRSDD